MTKAENGSRFGSPMTDVTAAEALADRLSGAGVHSFDEVDALVDRVIAGNGAVMARLDKDVAPGLRRNLEARRATANTDQQAMSAPADHLGRARDVEGKFVAQSGSDSLGMPGRDSQGRFLPRGSRFESTRTSTTHSATSASDRPASFATLKADLDQSHVDLVEEFRAHRAWRTGMIEELVPREFRPRTRMPLVTRGGVFYIAPRFEQAIGIGEVSDARLIRSGIITAQMFLDSSNQYLSNLTGHPIEVIVAGKRDVDLTRLTGIDAHAADILRLLNVHSITRLAQRDPERLASDLKRMQEQYRMWEFPRLFASVGRVRGLIEQAGRMAEA